eukprot:2196403-Prorocentrum_lima.AAC.1
MYLIIGFHSCGYPLCRATGIHKLVPASGGEPRCRRGPLLRDKQMRNTRAETRRRTVQTCATTQINLFRLVQARRNNVTHNVSQHGEYAR